MKRIYWFFKFWRARPTFTMGYPISAKTAWALAKEAVKR